VDVPGVQLDEAHATLRPKQVEWVHTALAMGSWFLLWVDFGPRTQDMAATLIAQVVARTRQLPLFLTDGWKAYTAALLQVVGVVYRRRRRGKVGRKPKPRFVAPKNLFYAQVVKRRNTAGRVVDVRRRVVFGGPRRFGKQLRLRQLGETIQTAFMERWYGTLRGLVAPLRRRTRCLSWSRSRHRGKVWLLVSLYNFVLPHKSLRQGHTQRTPAMAIGLTDHVIDKESCFQLPYSLSKDRDFPVYIGDGSHLGGSARGEQDMHGRITNPDHGALDAYPHIFESACALRCSTNTQGLPSHRLPITPSPNASWHVPGQYSHHRLEGT